MNMTLGRSPQCRSSSTINSGCAAHSAEEAADWILQFYSVYHSLRYVGQHLVLRLQHPLVESAVERLTKEFRVLLRAGAIRQGAALPEEADATEIKHLPRLILDFNRKDYGLLIQLIHRINALGSPSTAISHQPSAIRKTRT
jgi:hypothetical protein